jgi:hypothetical protein
MGLRRAISLPFLRRVPPGMLWTGIALSLVLLVAVAPQVPKLARAATGRLPELGFLWRWQRSYEDLVLRSDPQPLAVGIGAASSPSAPAFDREVHNALAAAAEMRAAEPTRYDPSYRPLAFPGGDVPADTGVCTDLVVRALRDVGIDLQARVHADMASAFADYPQLWGVSEADPSIDHRRVPNLMVYLARHGRVLPISTDGADYRPGEIITWHLGLGTTHIGIVSRGRDPVTGRPLIAHHVGGQPTVDDVLFDWRIIGRFDLEMQEGETIGPD